MAVSKGGIIEDGIMTYMNYFQRKVREALEDLKLRGTMRMESEGKQYFINRGFKEIDLSISYSIKLFRKLIDRIVIGYGKGIDYMSFMNSVVLVFLITPQIFALIFWFHLTKT
jgi:outer membrane phospholipase A